MRGWSAANAMNSEMQMVSYELIPKIGIGPIRFGMTHREVYAAMGTTPSRILPRGKAVGEEDVSSFHFNGCFKVGYSTETFIVNFIGVFSDNGVDVVYKGIDLFNIEAEKVIALISAETPYDKELPEQGYSYVFTALELSLGRSGIPEKVEAENIDEDDLEYLEEERRKARFFDSVGLGVEGYYSVELKILLNRNKNW